MSNPRESKGLPCHHSVESLYEEHGEFVLRVIQKLVSDLQQADDIYQDLFLDLLIQPLYCPPDEVRAYLYRTACHQVVDHSRRGRKYREAVKEYRSGYSDPDGYEDKCPLIRAEQQQQASQLIKFMENHLPQCESQAIINRYKHEHDLEHTAHVMGVSRNTVAKYVCNGLKKIRSSLAMRGGHLDEII